jgi:hypothetical protein
MGAWHPIAPQQGDGQRRASNLWRMDSASLLRFAYLVEGGGMELSAERCPVAGRVYHPQRAGSATQQHMYATLLAQPVSWARSTRKPRAPLCPYSSFACIIGLLLGQAVFHNPGGRRSAVC